MKGAHDPSRWKLRCHTSGDLKLTWLRIEDCRQMLVKRSFGTINRQGECLPQNPVSNPTEKQLLSWLKAHDSDTGPADSSIAGLVFMTTVVEGKSMAVDD
jgi:hypothetical protein